MGERIDRWNNLGRPGQAPPTWDSSWKGHYQFNETFIYLFVCLFRAAPAAYGGSQARGSNWNCKLPAYTTTTAPQDPSCVCDLHHSSWQCRILNPRSKARDQTCVLMDASQIRFCWATEKTSQWEFHDLGLSWILEWQCLQEIVCWLTAGAKVNDFVVIRDPHNPYS